TSRTVTTFGSYSTVTGKEERSVTLSARSLMTRLSPALMLFCAGSKRRRGAGAWRSAGPGTLPAPLDRPVLSSGFVFGAVIGSARRAGRTCTLFAEPVNKGDKLVV